MRETENALFTKFAIFAVHLCSLFQVQVSCSVSYIDIIEFVVYIGWYFFFLNI